MKQIQLQEEYSLRRKMIVLSLGIFRPIMIVWLSTWLEIEAQSQMILHQTFYTKQVFLHHNFRRRFGVVFVFYFKSHSYNYFGQRSTSLNLTRVRKHGQSLWDGVEYNH